MGRRNPVVVYERIGNPFSTFFGKESLPDAPSLSCLPLLTSNNDPAIYADPTSEVAMGSQDLFDAGTSAQTTPALSDFDASRIRSDLSNRSAIQSTAPESANKLESVFIGLVDGEENAIRVVTLNDEFFGSAAWQDMKADLEALCSLMPEKPWDQVRSEISQRWATRVSVNLDPDDDPSISPSSLDRGQSKGTQGSLPDVHTRDFSSYQSEVAFEDMRTASRVVRGAKIEDSLQSRGARANGRTTRYPLPSLASTKPYGKQTSTVWRGWRGRALHLLGSFAPYAPPT
ncbi:hypothetical protein BCR39DRAFT_560048 [Naematelia encephala]|uniref:Uncharacterized protein n=1 Tax=Naematelia encephala TaxID=71784 RepID=A0A1Y2AZM6_9TREE|nr:hypothetical protein BCR39DRAFT_560048 [Naematelia encephala]